VKKALIGAAVFAFCGLVFLAVEAWMYNNALAEAGDNLQLWKASEPVRTKFINNKEILAAGGYVETRKGAPDVRTILNTLAKDFNINPATQIRVHSSASGAASMSKGDTVDLEAVSLKVMGTLLQRLHSEYPYLRVREIHAKVATNKPGDFKWTLQIATNSAQSDGSTAPEAEAAKAVGETESAAKETPTPSDTAESPPSKDDGN
jgi:hypothetical protein